MSSKTLHQIGLYSQKQPSHVRLLTYTGDHITVIGQITTKIKNKNTQSTKTFVVTDSDTPTIIGLQTCQSMNLIQRVQNIKKINVDSLLDQYADVFKELGYLSQNKYSIKIDNSVTPVIAAARKIPLALRDKVKKRTG